MVVQILNQKYHQTEIGLVPDDWQVISIGDHFEFKNGLNKEKRFFGKGTPIVNYLDVFNNPGIRRETAHGKVTVSSDELRAFNVRKGDVLFTRTSETIEEIGMASAVIEDLNDTVFSGFLLRARPKTDVFELQFKKYCFRSPVVRKQITSTSSQTTRALTSGKLLSKVRVPVPVEKAEQSAIAEALSDINELIKQLENLIEKKKNIKKGAMKELLAGEKRLSGFGGKWKFETLDSNSTLKARIGWQGLTTAEYLDRGEFYLVTGTDFSDGNIDWQNCHYVEEGRYDQDTNIQLKPRDVLITKDGTIGKVAFIDKLEKPATLNSGIFVIRPKFDSYEPRFLFYILYSEYFKAFLNRLSAGSTISHLYQKDFVNFEFPVPPTKEEQFAIAQVLSDMDSEIEQLQKKMQKCIMMKTGMMEQLLTGRARLR